MNDTKILEITVTQEMSAANVGSGMINVFSTPMMIAMMEKTCALLAAEYLEVGYTTVGTLVSVEHLAATPIGMKVKIEAKLTIHEGRRFCFDVVAFDEKEQIGRGKHERFSVDSEKFQKKANAKLI